MTELIHGYQPTDVPCPYCHATYGMLERGDDGQVRYRCWCGATAIVDDEAAPTP